MPPISSTTSQQQFIQVPQNAAKPDATGKANGTSNTNTQSTQTTQTAQAQATPAQTVKQVIAGASSGTGGIPESKYLRNSDSTFGPGHTVLPPFNPAKSSTQGSASSQPSASSDDSSVGAVDVEI